MPQGNIKIAEIQFSNASLLPEIAKMLAEGHTVTLRLKGYSMRPFLENGRDKALLKKLDHVNIGDPVLAETCSGNYVLHRIIRIDGKRVTLRGDGNINTETCDINDIKGTAIAFYRKGRNKPDRTDSLKWRTYSFLWTQLLPIRRYLLYGYRKINEWTSVCR